MSSFFIYESSQILLCRATLNELISAAQVQHLVFGLVELHEVLMGLVLKFSALLQLHVLCRLG